MTSFIISNNNRLLLLPSLPSDSYQKASDHLENVPIKQLLKTDLSQFKRDSIPQLWSSNYNYTYNNQSHNNLTQDSFPTSRLSISSNASSVGSDDYYNSRSRSSIFSNESDDNGFSSSSSDEEEDEEESKVVPARMDPKLVKRSQSTETQVVPNPGLIVPSKSTTPEPEYEEEEEEEEQVKEPSIPIKRLPSPEYELHESAKPKRQRVGPSCDLCRSKKIKCDAHVEIMELEVDPDELMLNKKSEIQDKSIINKFITSQELEEEFKLIYSNEKIIKFKSCTYCINKGKPCVYKRGYTKDDILRFNLSNNIKKKKKTSRAKRRKMLFKTKT